MSAIQILYAGRDGQQIASGPSLQIVLVLVLVLVIVIDPRSNLRQQIGYDYDDDGEHDYSEHDRH